MKRGSKKYLSIFKIQMTCQNRYRGKREIRILNQNQCK